MYNLETVISLFDTGWSLVLGTGDEYHYIFECTEFINERKLYFDFVHINRHNIIKYNNLIIFVIYIFISHNQFTEVQR
jgi:hypothetical protein